MTRKVFILALAAGLVVSAAQAGFSISQTSGAHHSRGGQFTLTQLSGPLVPDVAITQIGDSIQTFCVDNEVLTGGPYTGAVSTQVLQSNTPLAQQVAYLYTQFRTTLAGGTSDFAGSYAYVQNNADATLLQEAIWTYMGVGIGTPATTSNNKFYELAEMHVNGFQGAQVTWSGIGNVRVLNVYDSQGRNSQDQLILIPAPAAATLGLLGCSLFGMLRRRLA